MTVLVTRPAPDNCATATALAAHGFDSLLAPMLTFQALPFRDDGETRYSGVIVTSANALRAVAGHPLLAKLDDRPLFAVGAQTAKAARDAGFRDIVTAGGDAASLRDSVIAHRMKAVPDAPWLYLAAADVSRDLATELRARSIPVATRQVYRMAMADRFPRDVMDAFAQGRIAAVLHYSRRSAEAFVIAARQAGFEIAGLALPQFCLSERTAEILRNAGSTRVIVADAPREEALIAALTRGVPPSLRPA